MRVFHTLLAGLLVVAGVLPSLAGAGGKDAAVDRDAAGALVSLVFDRLDCNMSGRVDVSEVDEHIALLWMPIDIDRSQTLQRHEYAMTHRTVGDDVAETLFRDADSNADGVVDVREFRQHVKRMILVLDANGDGEIDRADAGLAALPDFRSPRLRIGTAGPGHQ
jgi:hypothetical protein